jgi:hypothetical protein
MNEEQKVLLGLERCILLQALAESYLLRKTGKHFYEEYPNVKEEYGLLVKEHVELLRSFLEEDFEARGLNLKDCLDKKGEVIKSIDSNLKIYRFESHNPTDKLNRFAAYDKASNSTLVYAYDEETNKIKVATTLSNKVTQRYLDNRRVLCVTVTPNGKYGLVTSTDKNLIPHVYDSITKEHLKMRYINASRVVSDSIFKVAIRKDGETKYGAYDMEGHNILPSKYANIDLSESAKMVDGTYRFMVSSVGRYYGVVDSNGETLVPLKYIHFPSNKETVTQRAGKGATIERLVLSRPNGEKVFYNVFADNILATPEEQKAIVKIYQGSSKNPTFATRSASVDRSLVYGRTSSDDDMVND